MGSQDLGPEDVGSLLSRGALKQVNRVMGVHLELIFFSSIQCSSKRERALCRKGAQRATAVDSRKITSKNIAIGSAEREVRRLFRASWRVREIAILSFTNKIKVVQ